MMQAGGQRATLCLTVMTGQRSHHTKMERLDTCKFIPIVVLTLLTERHVKRAWVCKTKNYRNVETKTKKGKTTYIHTYFI